MGNYAEFYKSYTDTLAAYAKVARLDAEQDYSEFETTLQRKYEEGFADAMAHAFTLITGNIPDDDLFETSCDDFECEGCDSNYCENRCPGCSQANLLHYACPSAKDSCIACCGCPEHLAEGWTPEDTEVIRLP